MIMPSTRYTSLCNICNICNICPQNVFFNSSNVDDFHWNRNDYMELSSIFSINDNNSSDVIFHISHCSSFCNEKRDPDINFQNALNANTLYFATE